MFAVDTTRSWVRGLLVVLVLILANGVAGAATIDQTLGPRLSKGASIVHSSSAAPRWSDYDAPQPGTVVNVATENDVLVTVQYCNQANIRFLAQNGGNAWATTFKIGPNDLTINLAALNQVKFSSNKSQVTFQGGTTISQLVEAAYENGAQVITGNCDCVGALGAVLGGGYGRLMGKYGFGVDNLLSVNLVTAAGTLITVTSCVTDRNSDLWWALRGAGPNFGIVTSATMKSYPVPAAQSTAWLGPLIFTDDKIEALVSAINNLNLTPSMAIFLYFATTGPPDNTPMVIVIPFYLGTADAGKAAFASIYAIGPIVDQTAIYPYNEWNAGSASFCVKGGRKPSFGAGLAKMDPATWRAVWNQYVAFLQNPGTGGSVVLLEAYSLAVAKSLPDSSASFPFRSTIKFNAVAIPWYYNTSLDATAVSFGSKVRSLLQSTSGLSTPSTYINFAFGDENLKTVYGNNVARLQSLKQAYDPKGRFNQFFPI